ncbi:hypothetical protein [Clostridium tyrobutyricum]|uniref:hypothetical protein n=1 Tax=Clostridium tyrobutyricum TaxID=1519 RepID=UPI0005803635|nr:hypothetical protein [Clostridium tyrobutyricum]MBV4427181.1 hypothetical protein [Clostridium tyrobutyricum]MBV4442484.1 hypothetical protein [Clostridium tyrobutyricum]
MPYKHGAYGELIESTQQISTLSQGTIPVYVGTAPVHRLLDYKKSINTPLLINNLDEAKTKLGYSDNDKFEDFTLSAAVYAHFKNKIQPIGPIVLINVLNPLEHFKDVENDSVILVNNVGYVDNYVVLGSVKIGEFVSGIDYKDEYTTDGKLKLTIINPEISSPVSISYKKVDISLVENSHIVGNYDPATDKRTGLSCINTVYEDLNVVPSVISAPGWNHIPEIESEIIALCSEIGGHWKATCVTDIDPVVKTIDEAKNWKVSHNYINKIEKVCWPKVELNGQSIWMSILTIVRMQQTDFSNSGVPYESCSNKQIDITGILFGDGTRTRFNQEQGNKLNEKGITTVIFYGGKWVVWGPHMANYEYGITEAESSNYGNIFDSNIRTNIYLSNDFQLRNAAIIDSPIVRNDLDGILNTEQMRLNSLIADGKLLYGKIEFIVGENQDSDVVQGNFTFSTAVTNTPPAKSLTNKIQYTSQGMSKLTDGGGI